MSKKNILHQLFDIRPVDYRGNLDWEKIFKARRIVNFVHLVEGYERSFTSRRMKLFVNDRRGRELFKHYLQIKKPLFPISRPEPEEFAAGLVANLTRPPEIVFEYRPQIVENPEVFPSREELLNQLENICRIDFAVESSPLFSQNSPVKLSASQFESRGWFSKLKSRSKTLKINRFPLAVSLLSIFLISSFLFSNFIEEKASRTLKTADYLKARENIMKSRDLLAMVDFYQDSRTFESFERGLIVSKQKIDKISRALLDILENSSDARAVSSLVELTKLFNQTSESFSSAIEFYSGKNFFALLAGEEPKPETLTSLLGKSNQNFEQVLASLDEIKSKLEKIDRGFLPADAADEIFNLGDKTSALASSVKNFLESNRFLLKFLGGEGSKRFLIVFQNPVNLRPTGGSVSGYAIVGVDRGILTDLFFEDAFNVDNYKERVIPPRPLQRLNLNWGMGDANWFFDFSISAQKLMWFSEKAGSPKIDYVVALSPRFFEDLLKITGSVNLADAKKIVNAENFREILRSGPGALNFNSSQFVRIMNEFFPKFLQKLAELERTSSFNALDLINKNLEEKNILIYAAEPSPQDYLKKTGWAGEVKKEKGNYLAVVDSVINSGLKTSFKKSIKHHSEIQPDGRIVNTLTLSYGYQGKSDSEPELANFVRIFVPEGSELLEAAIPEQEVYFPPLDYYIAGFRADNDVAEAEYNLITDVSGVQIFAESGKTVFGFWVLAPAGQNKTLTLKYRLPLRISPESDFYSFYIQKQPADYSDFESVLAFPKNLKPTGRSAENLQVFSGLVKLSGQLDKDKYYEVRFER